MPHFSPFGVIIIVVFYAVAAGLLLLLARLLRRWAGRWFVIAPLVLIAIALPWVDEIYITHRFAKLCEGAGVQVKRKVEVEGFYDNTMRSGYELINEFGFRFMEYPLSDKGKIGHVEKVGGTWRKTVLDHPTARYHYRRIFNYRDGEGIHYEKWVDYRIAMTGEEVIDSDTGEEIARRVEYIRYPGWVESLWVRFFGTGQEICYGPLNQPNEQKRGLLYEYAFKPTNK